MRGKVECHLKQFAGNRITPAYAGKSFWYRPFGRYFWDHPRLCGEKSHLYAQATPPNRITPAYAGKSSHLHAGTDTQQDHPRLCGEKGSGKSLHAVSLRITPAYAGKSNVVLCVRITTEDHPRLCGEKYWVQMPSIRSQGSPPPMRGKVRVGEAYSRAYRITPAYAGKSSVFIFFIPP